MKFLIDIVFIDECHCVAKSESGEWKDFVIICEVTRINASLENHYIDFKKRF